MLKTLPAFLIASPQRGLKSPEQGAATAPVYLKNTYIKHCGLVAV